MAKRKGNRSTTLKGIASITENSKTKDDISAMQVYEKELMLKSNVSNVSVPNATALERENRELPKEKGIVDIWLDDVRGSLGMSKYDQLGTSIPYIYNIAGDLLVNPSTVSPSTMKKMAETDDLINPLILNTINAVINTIEDYSHPVPAVQNHIRVAIRHNQRGWRNMLRDMLTYLVQGFSRQEMVWGWCEELRADIVILTRPLPQNSIIFRVDAYGDLQEEGVGQYVFNSFYPGFSSLNSYGMGNVFAPILGGCSGNYYNNSYNCAPGAGAPDPYASLGDMDTPYRTYMISPVGLVWLPTEKTIGICDYSLTNGKNPYGIGIRQVYNLWVQKLAVIEFMLEMLSKKSAPLLVGYARPDVPAVAAIQGQTPLSAPEQMTRVLKSANSSSAITFAGMKDEVYNLEAIQIEGDLEIFLEVLKWINDCIMTALVTPKTTFGADGGGSYALSYSQSDVHARYVMSVRKDLTEEILQQYIKPVLDEAFEPEEYENNLGTFNIERTSIDDQVKLMTIYQPAIESGLADVTNLEDYNRMRENIGMDAVKEVPAWVVEKAKNSAMENSPAPEKKREKMDGTEKPYAHSKEK